MQERILEICYRGKNEQTHVTLDKVEGGFWSDLPVSSLAQHQSTPNNCMGFPFFKDIKYYFSQKLRLLVDIFYQWLLFLM